MQVFTAVETAYGKFKLELNGSSLHLWKDGTLLSPSHFGDPQWRPATAVRIGDVYALKLLHPAFGSATWYFDRGGVYHANAFAGVPPKLQQTMRSVLVAEFSGLWSEFLRACRPDQTEIASTSVFLTLDPNCFHELLTEVLDEVAPIKVMVDGPACWPKGAWPEPLTVGDRVLSFDGCETALTHWRTQSFADGIVANGYASSVSPLSGTTLQSDLSICITPWLFAYPFKDEEDVYFVLMGDDMWRPLALYFPTAGLVIVGSHNIGHPIGFDKLGYHLFLHVLRSWGAFNHYLGHRPHQVAVALDNAHLGHHLWNELSGIDRFSRMAERDRISKLLVLFAESTELWGPIDQIFDWASGKVDRTLTNNYFVANHAYAHGFLMLRPSCITISEGLAQRIRDHAARSGKMGESTRNFLAQRSQYKLVVVLGLRVENRTWDNQTAGLIEIVRLGAERYGKCAFIVDGHNLLAHSPDRTIPSASENLQTYGDRDPVAAEKEILTALREAFRDDPRVDIVNGIELSVEESVTLVESADCFIAPWGAGLAKYKWVSNKPGIILASAWNRRHRGDLPIYESPAYREGAFPCIYLDDRYIEDCPESPRLVDIPGDIRANFLVDLEGLLAAVEALFQTITGGQYLTDLLRLGP